MHQLEDKKKKKCDGTIVSISRPDSISKAVLQQIAHKPSKRQAALKTAEWLSMYLCVSTENSQIGQVGISHNEPCRERREGGGVVVRAKKRRKEAKERGRKTE